MGWVLCPCCSELLATDGIGNVVMHLIAFHPHSQEAQLVMRVLALMPLPEAV